MAMHTYTTYLNQESIQYGGKISIQRKVKSKDCYIKSLKRKQNHVILKMNMVEHFEYKLVFCF